MPVPNAQLQSHSKKELHMLRTIPRLELHPVQELNSRNQKSQGLPRTCPRRTQYILPREQRWDRLFLDGSHGRKAHLGEGSGRRL